MALWVVRIGALVSLPLIALACVANDWHPLRAVRNAVLLSVPFAVVLAYLASPAHSKRVGWGLLLAAATATVALLLFVLVGPSLLGGDLGGPATGALWLFPLAQLAILGAALRARRAFPSQALRRSSRVLVALSGLVYLVLVAAALGPSFEHPPYIGNDSYARGEVRSLVSAEAAFSSSTGSFGTLRCIAAPSACVRDFPVELSFGDQSGKLAENDIRRGYRFELHGVPAPGEFEGALREFAYVAVPLDTRGFPGWRRTGIRGYCGDATGRICYTQDGSPPPVVDGRCGEPCRDLQ